MQRANVVRLATDNLVKNLTLLATWLSPDLQSLESVLHVVNGLKENSKYNLTQCVIAARKGFINPKKRQLFNRRL